MPPASGRPVSVLRWRGRRPLDLTALMRGISALRLDGHTWSNAPGDQYAAHTHPYDKVVIVLEGSIAFILPGSKRGVTLQEGDRLELRAGVLHAAVVGTEGVTCWEAQRRAQ
jgi:quercetin dioxygenase-like cupin family protein